MLVIIIDLLFKVNDKNACLLNIHFRHWCVLFDNIYFFFSDHYYSEKII